MHGVGAALPIDWGGTALFLSVRLCGLGGGRRVRARGFPRPGYQCPGLRVLFPTPDHGRPHCATLGGMRGPRSGPFAGCEGVLVPLVQLAAVRSIEVAAMAEEGCFQWPSPDGGLKSWRYPRWRMMAYALDFRTTG